MDYQHVHLFLDAIQTAPVSAIALDRVASIRDDRGDDPDRTDGMV